MLAKTEEVQSQLVILGLYILTFVEGASIYYVHGGRGKGCNKDVPPGMENDNGQGNDAASIWIRGFIPKAFN